MSKNDEKSIEDQLKDAQDVLLVKPGEKIAGALSYLNVLNPLSKNTKNNTKEEKKCSVKTYKHNGITWLDIENPNRREINQLGKDFPFHPLHLEACLWRGQLAHYEKEDKYLFILFHIPSLHPTENKVVTNQICVFLGKNYLVTVHEDNAPSIRSLFKSCEEDEEQREIFFKKSSGYLLYSFIDYMAKDFSNLLQATLQELDTIEDLVFDIKVSGAQKISQSRQKIIKLRRITTSFKNILQEVGSIQYDITGDNLSRYYKNLGNVINKLGETLEEGKETVEIYKDADYTVSTEKTNEILTVLTIIFTLLLPATLIGTFYGMNILLPGGIETEPWNFWGQYTTLIIVGAASGILVAFMLLYFKYKKWF